MGLVVEFNERNGVTWPIDPATGIGVRSSPRQTDKEIETCGLCHARRAQLKDGYVPGHSLGTTEQVALLEPGLFWADGQMRDEVYNYAPFLQSRMYRKGVTCSDCHDPHTQQLRAPGRPGVPVMSREGEVRGPGARSSSRRDEAGGLRELPHAPLDVHGHRFAP